MKRLSVVCGLFCALMLGIFAVSAAQKGADFSGTWELDKAKSQLPQMMADAIQSATWTVTQDDKQLSREQKMERNPNAQGPGGGGGRGGGGMMGGGGALTVKLDGSETTSDTQRGKSTTKAKWMDGGKILEISTVLSGEFQGNAFTMTTTEHWELADGGKTLKVHRKQETPRGQQESTWTFTKK
jgi:hypothetical protein